MAEERGIEEVKDILDFMFSFIEAVGKARKDGEMSWGDARYFIDPVKKLFDAVEDIEEVLINESVVKNNSEPLIIHSKSKKTTAA